MKYIVFLLFLPFFSKASLYIAPYGSVGASYSSTLSDSPSMFMTYGLGARLGYRLSFVHTGVDVFWNYHDIGNSSRFHSLEIYHQPNSIKGFSQAGRSVSLQYSENKAPFQPVSIGVFGAVELPFLINAHGTIFYSRGERQDITHHGYGIKAGVSYLTSFYVQLNLGLKWAHYICRSDDKCSDDFNILSALLTLSVPFSYDVFGGRADSEETSFSDPNETSSSY